MKLARQIPEPYKVREIDHKEGMRLEGNFVTSIRPGKKAGDATVSDLCAYKYLTTEGGHPTIQYKLHWYEDWTLLPSRLSSEEKTWQPMFTDKLRITARKFQDLQGMKHVLPQHAQTFYDSLPHQQ